MDGRLRLAAADVPYSGGSGGPPDPLEVDGRVVTISALSMGNPHAVQVVDDADVAPVTTEGSRIERHPRFPRGVNAGYMQVVDRANG